MATNHNRQHDEDKSVLTPEGQDRTANIVASLVIAFFVVLAIGAALTGSPDLLFALRWLAFGVAVCYVITAICQAVSEDGEAAALSAFMVFALLLAWYLTGPSMGWAQPHLRWGHWDPALLVLSVEGLATAPPGAPLPVCFIPVFHSPLASFFGSS